MSHGLREVFARAHEIREVIDNSPLVTCALHRLLLAILHRVVEGPRDDSHWRKLWDLGRFDADRFDRYFDRWKSRFDLFHPEFPFFQVGGLVLGDGDPEEDGAAVTKLAVELASGNNATLFDHSIDERIEPRGPAWCARQMLATQMFGLGGGKGPTSNRFGVHPYMSHAPMVGGVAVSLQMEDLFRTLMANAVVTDESRPFVSEVGDQPVWERTDVRPPKPTAPDGYLDFLTFPSRYLRLIPEDGSGEVRVRRVFFAPGLALGRPEDDSPLWLYRNPMWAYRSHEKFGVLPIGMRSDKAIWRDSSAIFTLSDPTHKDAGLRPLVLSQAQRTMYRRVLGGDAYLRARCVGLANDKAKPILWRSEAIPFPIRLLAESEAVEVLHASITAIEGIAADLGDAFRSLSSRVLGTDQKTPDPVAVRAHRDRLMEVSGFWPAVEEGFHPFMRRVATDGLAARKEWIDAAVGHARSAFESALQFCPGSPARRERAWAMTVGPLAASLARRRPEEGANP